LKGKTNEEKLVVYLNEDGSVDETTPLRLGIRSLQEQLTKLRQDMQQLGGILHQRIDNLREMIPRNN